MTTNPAPLGDARPGLRPVGASRFREAGAAAARPALSGRHRVRLRYEPEKLQAAMVKAARASDESARSWLVDNLRMIRTAVKETSELSRSLRAFPVVTDASGAVIPRVCALVHEYLEAAGGAFSEDDLAAFLEGYQDVIELQMGEVWAVKPALQRALLERMTAQSPSNWPVLISSLRRIGETAWKELFESANVVDRVLSRDPAGAYNGMDYLSRDSYRTVIASLRKRSEKSESEIAEVTVELAKQARRTGGATRATARRTHVGFYLVDSGLPMLRARIGYRPSPADRLRDFVLRNATGYYLVGVEILTFVIAAALLSGLGSFTPIAAGLLLLLLPATQAAVDFMNNLTAFILPPRALPKLDFSKGIPDDCVTIVAVPSLLLNEAQVRDLVLDLEIRYLANRDRNLAFALLTDSPDSDQPDDERDTLAATCVELVEALNRRYGGDGSSPFYLFHRHRTFNPSEGRWMGWERKRGKLLDLNQLLRGGFDSFPVKVGDLTVLPLVQYVITLDSDTQLPRDSASKIIGAIAHPLNRPVVDPRTRMVVEGYGILQPRIGISIQSASRSRMAAIYSGQTGFDIYTHATSDVYQDLFAEGIFTGKGIYEVDALNEVLGQRFPENALLSHDLIEGAYARAGLVSDIELIDDYPSHFSAYSRRKHRWVRGDWQITRWLGARVPDFQRRLVTNPISIISRWKILDNLRRSVLEASMLLVLLAGWLYLPGRAWYWTAATGAMLLLPVYESLFFSLLRAPWGSRAIVPWARETRDAFVKGHVVAGLSLVFLLHQALLSVDAIARSVLRVMVTKRKLLEWETAAEAESAVRRKATVDIYLEWTPWLSALIALQVWLVHRSALPIAAPVLALWFASRFISAWLNGAPRTSNRALSSEDTALLRESAEHMYRFFRDWSSQATNWLIPDNVREDGEAALRLSPTNLGMLLNARVAVVHLGLLPLAQFVFETLRTLDTLSQLPKYNGHLLNWYDVTTLAPLEPRFVSTVDSGNLVACLWTLKQAALSFVAEPKSKHGITSELAVQLYKIAEDCHRLAQATDFRFLYNAKKKVLSVGYDVTTGRLERSTYDLLASESRIASFVAIAKGDLPQEAWFHLGREHAIVRGERVLISWTGTMFEYLMPALWMRHHSGTITEQSMRAAVHIQREFGRRKGVPWGVSESACSAETGCEYGYSPFGVPELAMKRTDSGALVVSPYSTFLALAVDPASAIKNLRRMEELGWSGRYGFYDAADYSRAGADVIRSWMAHHQGMSLLAACNLLFDNPIQRCFHAEPQVLATELLLHERVPNTVIAHEVELERFPLGRTLEAAG